MEQGRDLGDGERNGRVEDSYKLKSASREGQLLLPPCSLIIRARLLGCWGTGVALTAPWSLSLGGGLALSRQSPLIHLKPQAAFAKWDFKQ